MQVARDFTHERTKQRIAHLNAIAAAPAIKAQPVMPQRSPRGRGMTRQANQFFVRQQLKELNLNEPTFMHRPPCWAPNWRLQSTNSLTLPGRTPRRMRVTPRVHWMPNSMPAWARRLTPQGARRKCPQLIGTAKGIAPCGGSITGHIGNSVGPKVDG